MSKALQSWTPRARPLVYDSLLQDIGCQDTVAGTGFFQIKPFERICVAEHEVSSTSVFNQLDTVSYALGPFHTSDPHPWITNWAAWVASAGIRVGKFPVITPPANSLGNISSLYPTTTPTRVAVGFTRGGEIGIAIQKTETGIELKWFGDNTGTDIQVRTFPGVSPVLFNSGLAQQGSAEESDLVIYYLRPEEPNTIFARFQQQGFLVENELNTNLQASLSKLIATGMFGPKQLMFARDIFGRDITLYTGDYVTRLESEKKEVTLAFVSGSYNETAIEETVTSEESDLALIFVSGKYSDPIQEPGSPLSDPGSNLTIGFIAGEYSA